MVEDIGSLESRSPVSADLHLELVNKRSDSIQEPAGHGRKYMTSMKKILAVSEEGRRKGG